MRFFGYLDHLLVPHTFNKEHLYPASPSMNPTPPKKLQWSKISSALITPLFLPCVAQARCCRRWQSFQGRCHQKTINKDNVHSQLSSHQKKILKVDNHNGVAIAGRVLSRYMQSSNTSSPQY